MVVLHHLHGVSCDFLPPLRMPFAAQYCAGVRMAVNSVISHYATLCERENIAFKSTLTVFQDNELVLDSDLCVIFGNLLENAVEACRRVADGKKYIEINSTLQYKLLTVTMDNSFDGKVTVDGGKFRSRKRADFGIGLSSIQSVARKHHGDADFKTNGKIFLSSVYLKV